MATPTERIKMLIPCLSEKDAKYAYKFVEERNFESLRDLVKSAIVITKNKMKGCSDLEKELVVSNIESLYSEIDEYCLLLGIDDVYEEDEDDILNEEEDIPNYEDY